MSDHNSAAQYGTTARLLHWLIAALIVTQFVLAQLAERAAEADSPVIRIGLLANHKSVGMTILALAILRLLWRFISPPPAMPLTMSAWQRVAAHLSHWLLYLFMFALPATGWLMSSAATFTVSWFGLFEFPNLLAADEGLTDTLKSVHHLLSKALIALAVVHIAAALKHHFVDKDDVLRRMSSVTSITVFVVIAVASAWVLSDVGTRRESAADPVREAARTSERATTQRGNVGLPLWVVDHARSTITFSAEQAGGEFNGIWRSWQAELRFEQSDLAASSFDVSVDVASVDTQSADRDQTMMDTEWFDQGNYPSARFATEQIHMNVDGTYTADAFLTIKGVATRITFDFRVREDSGRQVLEGISTILEGHSLLDRLALSLGTGQWTDTKQVGQFVKVQVHVEALVP